MTEFLPIYTEDPVTPKVVEVIKEIIADKFPGENIQPVTFSPLDRAVLVLGKVTVPDAIPKNVRTEFTYSIPQMMVKANAATVIASGIQRVLRKPVAPLLDMRYTYVTGWGEVWHGKFDFSKPVAIDIETSGNLGKVHTPEEVGLLSVAIYQPGVGARVYVSEDNIRDRPVGEPMGVFSQDEADRMGEFLAKFECAIYHNGKFDIRVLNRVCRVQLHNWFDTMLAHHVLNQAAGTHGLKELCKLYFGAAEWEVGLSKYTKGGGYYELIPLSVLVTYNAWDVYWTYQLFELLDPQIDADEDAQKAFMVEMSAAEFLLKVESRGIPFDKQYAEQLAEKLGYDADQSLGKMRVMVKDFAFNPNSPQQVKRMLDEVYDYSVESTSKETMETILELEADDVPLCEFVKELLKFRKAKKQIGTYAQGWAAFERKGRVHPTFLVHGTTTGRLSSTSPNAQNVPRDKTIRKMVALNGTN